VSAAAPPRLPNHSNAEQEAAATWREAGGRQLWLFCIGKTPNHSGQASAWTLLSLSPPPPLSPLSCHVPERGTRKSTHACDVAGYCSARKCARCCDEGEKVHTRLAAFPNGTCSSEMQHFRTGRAVRKCCTGVRPLMHTCTLSRIQHNVCMCNLEGCFRPRVARACRTCV
jgi:hypothetical protein